MGLFSNFTISKAMADTSGIGNFPSNGYDLHQDWGRASNDYRSRAFVGGYWSLWRNISLDPFVIYQSSVPFNIVLGQDLNGDTQFNDRPAFAQAHHLFIDAAVRIEKEILAAQHFNRLINDMVIEQDRAQNGTLRLNVGGESFIEKWIGMTGF